MGDGRRGKRDKRGDLLSSAAARRSCRVLNFGHTSTALHRGADVQFVSGQFDQFPFVEYYE
jgi:hypothetical protein